MPSSQPNLLAYGFLCLIVVLGLAGLAWACYDGLTGDAAGMSRGNAMLLSAAALALIGRLFFKGDDDAE